MSMSNILKITGRLMIPRLFCLEPFSLYSQYKVVLVCFEIDGNWLVPMLSLKNLTGIGFKNVSVFSKFFTGISVFWIAFLVFKFVIPVMTASNWTFPLLYCFNRVYTRITFKYRFQDWMWNIISTGSIPLYSGVFERKSNLN